MKEGSLVTVAGISADDRFQNLSVLTDIISTHVLASSHPSSSGINGPLCKIINFKRAGGPMFKTYQFAPNIAVMRLHS